MTRVRILTVGAMIAVLGCGTGATSTGATSSTASATATASAPAPWAGVAACDEYFTAVRECKNDRAPPGMPSAKPMKEMVGDNLEAVKDDWAAKAATADEVGGDCAKWRDEVKDICTVGFAGVPACDAFFKSVDACKAAAAKKTWSDNAESYRKEWEFTPSSKVKELCEAASEELANVCK